MMTARSKLPSVAVDCPVNGGIGSPGHLIIGAKIEYITNVELFKLRDSIGCHLWRNLRFFVFPSTINRR
jgi:hypothetical protein